MPNSWIVSFPESVNADTPPKPSPRKFQSAPESSTAVAVLAVGEVKIGRNVAVEKSGTTSQLPATDALVEVAPVHVTSVATVDGLSNTFTEPCASQALSAAA